jgi:hypothetical protein
MSGHNGWDELLNEAQERMREQEDENPNSELGDEMTPAPEAHFAGRWRGDGKMQTKQGTRDVFLVWDRNDEPGFLYAHSGLVDEVTTEKPDIGDRVLVLRGPTRTWEKDGEEREYFPYVLRKQVCPDPLPGQPALEQPDTDEPKGTQLDDDDEFPFLCPGEHDTRSAPVAAAATG